MDTGRGEAGEGGFYRMGARRPGPRQRAPQCYPRRTGFSRGLLTWPLPLRRQGEAGRGCPRFALIPKTPLPNPPRSEEHTSELQSLMRISYAVFCLKKKNNSSKHLHSTHNITTQTNYTENNA